MKLEVKNIGLIREAEIELDGVTVLAGFNGTGKSTISKALYGIMAGFADLPKKIMQERTESIREIIRSYLNRIEYHIIAYDIPVFTDVDDPESPLYQLPFEFAGNKRTVPESYDAFCMEIPNFAYYQFNDSLARKLYPKVSRKLQDAIRRPSKEYARFVLSKNFTAIFEGQVNYLGNSGNGKITLIRRAGQFSVFIKNNKVISFPDNTLPETTPVYLEPRHMLDISGTRSRTIPYDQNLWQLLSNGGNAEIGEESVTFEQAEVREKVSDMIDAVIHGKLAEQQDILMFQDARFGTPVSIRNMASGSKTFAVLRRLVEQGALRENGTLIIDEPENNLHPAWQVKLAEVLVMLHRELEIRLLVNTHSTYFLRGIEVAARKCELSDKCHYYTTEPADDGLFRTVCVDGNTSRIYGDFYQPFEGLDIPEDL